MQRTIDRNYIALAQHLLQCVYTTASNLFFQFGCKRLVIKIKQLFAVKRLQPSQHSLSDTTNGHGTDDLILEIVFTLGNGSNIPVTVLDHLMRRDEVSNQGKYGHDDMLSYRNDVGAGDLCYSDTTVGLIRSVEVDMIRADAGSHGELEFLRLLQAFSGQVTWVEAIEGDSSACM